MSKITIDMQEICKTGPNHITPEEVQKVFQILLSTLSIFQNIGWGDGVEVIKATISKTNERPKTDFYMSIISPVHPPVIRLKPEEIKIFCSWTDFSPFFFVSNKDLSTYSPLRSIYLKNNEIKTIAATLVEAVGIVIDNLIKGSDETKNWLMTTRRSLRPPKL
jgi:hypothetical protein